MQQNDRLEKNKDFFQGKQLFNTKLLPKENRIMFTHCIKQASILAAGTLIMTGITGITVMADVKLSENFKNNMVIQRDTSTLVWGWAKPSEKVTVTGSWGKSAKTTAAKNGKWSVKLTTPKAGGPFKIIIQGNNKIELKNVLLGEVLDIGVLNTCIPELKDFKVVYIMDPSNPKTTNGGKTMLYSTDKRSEIIGDIDKIAYALVLNNKDYVFVSMDPFTKDLDKIGVPTAASKAVFQQKIKNMFVKSNVKDVKNGKFPDGGNIEFWGSNYGSKNAVKVSDASHSKCDFGDLRRHDSLLGYGSMQVHNYKAKQTIFAFNNFRAGKRADLGIGNCSTKNPDWTFARNAGKYKSAKLYIMVKVK